MDPTRIRLGIDAGNFARDKRGMGRIARRIAAAALGDRGFEVTLLVERRRDESGVRDAFAGTHVAVRTAHSADRRGTYDLVWFPWNGMRYEPKGAALLTLNDAFAFTDPHPQRVAREREQAPIRRGVRRAAHIATISAWSKGEIVRVLGLDPTRITVIPPAPDPIFSPGNADLFMGAWRYVLIVGTREARKNARMLYDACARAFSGPRDMLAIVGELPKADAAVLHASGVRHTVLHDTDDETLRALYRNARVVAVPSTAEGFGLVAVEAMACGAPVLASNAAALPEATGGAALLLDPHDVAAWTEAIGRVFADDELAQTLSARGAARYAFTSRDRPAREYLALFRQLTAAA